MRKPEARLDLGVPVGSRGPWWQFNGVRRDKNLVPSTAHALEPSHAVLARPQRRCGGKLLRVRGGPLVDSQRSHILFQLGPNSVRVCDNTLQAAEPGKYLISVEQDETDLVRTTNRLVKVRGPHTGSWARRTNVYPT